MGRLDHGMGGPLRVFQVIGVFAGEAGLLGAWSGYSDTLLVAGGLAAVRSSDGYACAFSFGDSPIGGR